ncbi:methyltransferase domain-containing protein [Arthrobacter sp.]|uniref:methyltransferase domain-containing protein n=1 Tax=Arthrobacter sp. TaxID=1667 RepID=UPI0028109E54|nr:methyltransferase domain-containing protein [Arthrobacter sp.]
MTGVGNLFDDGAEHFERLAPVLWNTMGNVLVAAADLHLGHRVLDACCGSGSGTIPAAQEVGPEGRVDAVDLSVELLALAEAKAAALDLSSINFVNADASTWTSGEPYDAVLCGYGLFFLPDMAAGAVHLASQLRSGGKLAVSTWQEHAHEPFASLLREVCFEEQPQLREAAVPKPTRQMAEVASAEKLHAFLTTVGFESIEVHETPLQVPLDAELAWTLVLGTGYRFMLPSDPDGRERVRTRFLESLGQDMTLNADSLIAVATRS